MTAASRHIARLRDEIRAQRGLREIDGLPDAWSFEVTAAVSAAIALDGDDVYATTFLVPDKTGVVRAALEIAHERSGRSAIDESGLGHIAGGDHLPGSFDAIGLTSSSLRPLLSGVLGSDLPQRLIGVFPAFECEFSSQRAERDVLEARLHVMRPADISRTHQPFTTMRFSNERTGARSRNKGRGVGRVEVLRHELKELARSPGYVEFEDRLGRVQRVEWGVEGWMVNGRTVSIEDVESWVDQELHVGISLAH